MPLHINIHQVFKNITNNMKPKHQKLVQFGLQAYTLTSFRSAASNARAVVANYSTASRKSERLLANVGIGNALNNTLASLTKLTSTSIINVDHTNMEHLTALVGAVQTRNGRSIPVFTEATYAQDIPGLGSRASTRRTDTLRIARAQERERQSFREHISSALDEFLGRLSCTPRFAFDRGFGSCWLIEFLGKRQVIFYMRYKADRIVSDGFANLKIQELRDNDEAVELGGTLLRIVRSSQTKKCKEPWYIVTNDFVSSRAKILNIYFHRFEIEESFKDLKHLFDLRRARFNRPNSLKVILELVFIGFALLFRCQFMKPFSTYRKLRNLPKHPRKSLSWVRDMWELWQLLTRPDYFSDIGSSLIEECEKCG